MALDAMDIKAWDEAQSELASLRAKLAEVEQERDAANMAKDSVLGSYERWKSRAEAAEQDCDRLAAEVELWEKRWIWQGETLSKLSGEQVNTAQKIIKFLSNQLTSAQEENKRLAAEVGYLNDLLDATDHGRAEAAAGRDRLKLELEAQTKECRKAIDIGTACAYRAEKAEAALTAAQQSAQEQFRKGMEDLFLVVQTEVSKLRQEIQLPYAGPRFQQMLDAIRAELSKEEGK